MEYKFPDEPPIGSKVEDKDGKVWTRVRSYMSEWAPNDFSNYRKWEGLLKLGPLKDYVAPVNGDVRRIKDKESPGYFEVYIEGAWHQYFKGTGRDVVKYEEPVDW